MAENKSAAIVVRPVEKLTFPEMMGDKRVLGQLKRVLPRSLDYAKLAQVSLIYFRTSWGLAECQPMSVLSSLVEVAQVGLELDKTRGQAYLVPFRKECTFICGYRGYITLAKRTGDVDGVWGEIVHSGEPFQVLGGTDHQLHHEQVFPQSLEEKDWKGVYACMRLKDGFTDYEYLDLNKLQLYRGRSASYKAYVKDNTKENPWTKMPDKIAMWRKTAMRALMRRTDLSVEDQRQNPQTVALREELREGGLVKRSPELSDVGTDKEFSVLNVPTESEPLERAQRKAVNGEITEDFIDGGNDGQQSSGQVSQNANAGAKKDPPIDVRTSNQTSGGGTRAGNQPATQSGGQAAAARPAPKESTSKKRITDSQIKDLWKDAETCVSGFANLRGLMDSVLKKEGFTKPEQITENKLATISRQLRQGEPDPF